jgi:hypothetical protein
MSIRKKIKKYFSIIAILAILFIGFVYVYSAAAQEKGYRISVSIPGIKELKAKQKIADPGAYVKGLYNFAIGIAGILAVGMIVFGAIERILYAGNPSRQAEGRDRIIQAIYGLLLLLAAVLILNTIRPQITVLSLPKLDKAVVKKQPVQQTREPVMPDIKR